MMKPKLTYARYAWLPDQKFHEHIWVRSAGDRIAEVFQAEPNASSGAVADETVGILFPGFINAHCHLEYSHLAGKLPRGGVPFGEWLTAILTAERPDDETKSAAMAEGARKLAEGGTVLVFDSTTDGASEQYLRAAGVDYVLFHEALGLNSVRAELLWENAKKRYQSGQKKSSQTGIEQMPLHRLNPHAPYSVGEWLREELRHEAAGDYAQGYAWHLAETQDEIELFREGTGSLADFLDWFGMGRPWAGEVPGCSPWEFMRRERLAESCDLAFHGDRLTVEEAMYFSGGRGVVYCPGARRWFDRPAYPLKEFLDAGVNVCLGTDSLAGCESLSMLEMLRFTAEDHPELSDRELIGLVTHNPSRLNILRDACPFYGEIRPGGKAEFTTVPAEGFRGGFGDYLRENFGRR